MKFMQRGAAAQSPASPKTPASATDDGRPSKRQKLSKGAGRSSLEAQETASFVIDQKAAKAALEDEDRKRQAAMDRMAERLGDAHWVLDTAKLPTSHTQAGTPLKIVQVGFSEIDRRDTSEESLEGEDMARVFQSYGPIKQAKNPKKQAQKNKAGLSPTSQQCDSADVQLQNDTNSDSSSESDSDSNDSDSDSSSEELDEAAQSKPGRASYGTQKRAELKSKQKAAREKSRQMATNRRSKEVKLHKLQSISGAGGSSSFGSKKPGQRR